MAICSKCGSTISNGSSFCGACGSPVSLGNTVPPPGSGAAAAGLASNVAGALSYLAGLVTGIIFLVLEVRVAPPWRHAAYERIRDGLDYSALAAMLRE